MTNISNHRVTRFGLMILIVMGLSVAFVPQTAVASESFPSGNFQIQATGHNLCVDIPRNDAHAGADLWLWSCNGTVAQTFTYSNGRVINPASGLCLDVENNGGTLAKVQVSKCVGKDSRWNNAQAWRVHGRDLAVPGDRCLDVAGPHSAVAAKQATVINQCGYPAKNFKLVQVDGGSTVTPTPPKKDSSNLVKSIVTAAEKEHDRWSIRKGTRYTERDRWATPVLREYYDAAGWAPWNKRSDWKSYYAWSAAYISYVMQQAGAGDFTSSHRHFDYIKAGFSNTGSFRSLDPATTVVQAGDLVCTHRHKSTFSYASVKNVAARGETLKTHCDVVVVAGTKSVQVLGGNVGDPTDGYSYHTVGRNWFRTTNGILNKGKWIAVIRP